MKVRNALLSPPSLRSLSLANASYSDVALAFGVVAIIAMMVWPLPTMLIDGLVAINISVGVTLLLIAIYIPSPVAFPSFPSVLLLTTLFRLSLSVAVTRQILLNADAGHIIDTFGNMVVGGNLVVGLVVFLIITVVQFIVIAKGAERVAEVAARFTLDAMPGKQLSIDSDLRSGMMTKDEARAKRRHLEVESQLHGALDGAMKFVKGDAIAGIIIIIVNLLGGLAIGMLQNGMSLGTAILTYSILTIGDGLVAQIPALLSSISAGLVVTRTASEEGERHLGEAISRQLAGQPRVLMVGGAVALTMMLVPGFPKLIFLCLAAAMAGSAAWQMRDSVELFRWLFRRGPQLELARAPLPGKPRTALPAPLILEVQPAALAGLEAHGLHPVLANMVQRVRDEFGVPVPSLQVAEEPALAPGSFRLRAFGDTLGTGNISLPRLPETQTTRAQDTPAPPQPQALIAVAEVGDASLAVDAVQRNCELALRRHLVEFIGIQEASDLLNRIGLDYPDLVKETLRAVAPQRVADVLRRLVAEGVPVRNLRRVLEAIADNGAREKDVVALTENVRVALKRQISHRYADAEGTVHAVLVQPELEDRLRQCVRVTNAGSQLAVEPELANSIVKEVRTLLDAHTSPVQPVLVCSQDVRRHLRTLVETAFFELPVLSFQELTPDLQIIRMGQINV